MYFLNYVGKSFFFYQKSISWICADLPDRNAIAQARLNNLEKDLGMTGVQFNTTVSM
jgi:hypothetical protein